MKGNFKKSGGGLKVVYDITEEELIKIIERLLEYHQNFYHNKKSINQDYDHIKRLCKH